MDKANRLCMSCGMCCDGTMFDHANVVPDEKQQVMSAGLIVNEKLGKLSFEQPCRFYCHNLCSIYEQRPAVCISYRCKLLKKMNKDEVSLDAALDKVKMLRALQKRLAEVMPNAKHSPITSVEVYEMAATIDQQDTMQRKQYGIFLMSATKFIGMLTDHFWHKESPNSAAEENSPDILQNPNHGM